MKKHLKTTLLLAVCISLLAGCAQNDTASDSAADASLQSEISSTSETKTSAMSDTSVVDAPTAPAADALVTADGNFLYEECDGSITITKYVGKSEEITTPKEINGKPVTKIGENAFRCEYMEFPTAYDSECGDWIYVPYFGNAKHIVLSEGITELGPYAFSDYTIESVDIPSTVTIVGEGCFSECSVKCIEFPSEQPVSVGEGAFENSKELERISAKEFSEFDWNAVGYCEMLVGVDGITENTVLTGEHPLQDDVLCRRFGAVQSGDWWYRIVDGKAEIADYTGDFSKITVPSELDGYTVNSIGAFAFSTGMVGDDVDHQEKKVLGSIVMPDTVEKIGRYAFFNSTIKEIVFSPNLKEIGHHAFQYTHRYDYEIPDTADYILEETFDYGTVITHYSA